MISNPLLFSVFLSEGLYMEPSQVADNENGGLAHMKDTKVCVSSRIWSGVLCFHPTLKLIRASFRLHVIRCT